jgi:hypothetical protein
MSTDPTIQVVKDAIAFSTAAVIDHASAGMAVATSAIERDAEGFLDALVSVLQSLADELDEAGGDSAALLRDLGLGVELAALLDPDPRPDPR